MGTVWHARHPEGVDVAVKILRPEFAADQELMSSFRREVRAVASLDHPAIVRVFDFGTVPEPVASATGLAAGSPWLAMEHAEGTIGEISGSRTWGELSDLIQQLLGGLAHSHARRIVHRDIKPRNVLVHGVKPAEIGSPGAASPRYSLTDFGIAQAWSKVAHHAEAGTPGYMAPEQILGDWRSLGPGTDLYALGCLIWRMTTGRPPFEGPSAQAVMATQVSGRLGRLRPNFEVPPGFEEWLRKLLDVSPDRRFQSAADALLALRALGWGPGEAAVKSIPADWRPPYPTTTVRPNGTGLALFLLRPWPLVGREKVQDFLWNELRKTESTDKPRIVALVGGPGLGKSRLARWLCERAVETGSAWVFRVGHDRKGSHGLNEAVRGELRIDGLDRAQTIDRLTRLFASRGSPKPAEDSESLVQWLDGPPNAEPLPVVALLERFSQDRPLVLWVDDLHWATSTIALLERLGRTSKRLLVVTTLDLDLAPPARKAAIAALVDAGLRIDLGPLPLEDHRRLVDGGVGLESRLAGKLVARTAGNPSYAVRIVTEWARRGLLSPTSKGYGLRDPMSFVLPESLSLEIGSGLDGLDRRSMLALEALAILGGRVRESEWSGVCAELDAAQQREGKPAAVGIDAALRRELARRSLAIPSDDGGEVRWSFSPPLLREIVLERAGKAGRSPLLHEASARYLASEDRPQARERAVMHLVEAGKPAQALVALRSLIDDLSASASAARDPSEIAERTTSLLKSEIHLLDIAGVPPDDPRRLPGQIDALSLRMAREDVDPAEARKLASRAASRDRSSSGRAVLLAITSEDARATLRPDDPLFEIAHRDLEGKPALVTVHRLQASAYARTGALAQAERSLAAALEIAEIGDDPSERGSVLMALGEVIVHRDRTEAAQCLSVARDAFLAAKSVQGVAAVELCFARICRRQLDFVGALDHARRAHHTLTRGKRPTAPADRELGLVRLVRGELAQARAVLGQVQPVDVVTRTALLATAPTGGDWLDWDEIMRAIQAIFRPDTPPIMEPDTAWPLEWAAKRAADAGSLPRADAAYRLAEQQYRCVSDQASVERVSKRRAALPVTVTEPTGEKITAGRRPALDR